MPFVRDLWNGIAAACLHATMDLNGIAAAAAAAWKACLDFYLINHLQLSCCLLTEMEKRENSTDAYLGQKNSTKNS